MDNVYNFGDLSWISMTTSSRKDLMHLLFVGLTVSREEGGSVVWEGSTCQHIPRSWQFIMQSDDLFFKSEIFLDTIDFPNIRNFFVNGHQFFSQNIDKSKLISFRPMRRWYPSILKSILNQWKIVSLIGLKDPWPMKNSNTLKIFYF